MEEKHEEEDREVPLQRLFDGSSKTAGVHSDGRENKRRRHLLSESPVDGHFNVTPPEPGQSSFQIPGVSIPGIFFESYIPAWLPTTGIDGIATDCESYFEQFHDSESEDIYDLYNACNGAIHEGFLDIRKLDELNAGELEVLDLERLREIWFHTISGCGTCAEIVRTLNSVRGMLGDDGEEERLREPIHSREDKPH